MQATDWTTYYGNKRSWFSKVTQHFTLKELEKALRQCAEQKNGEPIEILELGGGNSCFAEKICAHFNVRTYNIIDNNELAAKLYDALELNAEEHHSILFDLLNEEALPDRSYDFVFSVGLIEHFRGSDIETVIDQHYRHCRDKGYVLITFPTPTTKYRRIRGLMERAGMWQFHDEQPLTWREVGAWFRSRGKVLAHYINWKLPLTQMVVVTRKCRKDADACR